uniref:Tf2-1-like SH3-like domain-containing protein n=1 Tax=Cajanus cajan TaxID=3821 RepID=A0A151R305_CAJCA|nr:hypothetical protein KK1_041919 [Cajanus cajan]
MKKYADSKRLDKNFEVDQWVWVKFHAYRQQSVARRLNFKLSKRYFGPFQILERIGKVAYRLNLPSNSRIHPVFHISLLKAYSGPTPPTSIMCDELPKHQLPTPQAITSERTVPTPEGNQYQVLVEWVDKPREEATWESWDHLVNLYTKAALEDKVLFHERGNVTTPEDKATKPRIKSAPSWATDYII